MVNFNRNVIAIEYECVFITVHIQWFKSHPFLDFVFIIAFFERILYFTFLESIFTKKKTFLQHFLTAIRTERLSFAIRLPVRKEKVCLISLRNNFWGEFTTGNPCFSWSRWCNKNYSLGLLCIPVNCETRSPVWKIRKKVIGFLSSFVKKSCIMLEDVHSIWPQPRKTLMQTLTGKRYPKISLLLSSRSGHESATLSFFGNSGPAKFRAEMWGRRRRVCQQRHVLRHDVAFPLHWGPQVLPSANRMRSSPFAQRKRIPDRRRHSCATGPPALASSDPTLGVCSLRWCSSVLSMDPDGRPLSLLLPPASHWLQRGHRQCPVIPSVRVGAAHRDWDRLHLSGLQRATVCKRRGSHQTPIGAPIRRFHAANMSASPGRFLRWSRVHRLRVGLGRVSVLEPIKSCPLAGSSARSLPQGSKEWAVHRRFQPLRQIPRRRTWYLQAGLRRAAGVSGEVREVGPGGNRVLGGELRLSRRTGGVREGEQVRRVDPEHDGTEALVRRCSWSSICCWKRKTGGG